MVQQIRQFWQEDDGATAIEYGLIAGLVAVVIIGGLAMIGGNLSSMFESIAGRLPTAVEGAGGGNQEGAGAGTGGV